MSFAYPAVLALAGRSRAADRVGLAADAAGGSRCRLTTAASRAAEAGRLLWAWPSRCRP